MPTVIKKINVYNGTSSSWNTYPIGVQAENIKVAVGQDTKNLQEAINGINTAIAGISSTVNLNTDQVTGVLPVAKGGTGSTSANSLAVNLASSVAGNPLSSSTIGVRGKLTVTNLSTLPATIINSGTFAVARIPELPATRISSGTFASARIPNLNASKITGGTLPPERGGTGKAKGLVWTSTASFSGTGTKTININKMDEIIVVGHASATIDNKKYYYDATCHIPLPTSILASSREWYLGGGRSGTSTTSLAGRRGVFTTSAKNSSGNVTFTGIKAIIDGKEASMTYDIYYR